MTCQNLITLVRSGFSPYVLTMYADTSNPVTGHVDSLGQYMIDVLILNQGIPGGCKISTSPSRSRLILANNNTLPQWSNKYGLHVIAE